MTLRDRSNAAGQCLNLPTLATSLSSGKTASVPVWWYFIHVTSKGITSATVAPLPCQPDLRQLRLEVLHTRIKDQALAQELRDFVEEYYAPSRASLKFRAGKLDDDTSDDTAWLGSSYFLNTVGYYDTDRALSSHSDWLYSASRDAGLADAGAGGYPPVNSGGPTIRLG